MHSAQSNHDCQGLEYLSWEESAGESIFINWERSHLWADVNNSPGKSEEIIKQMEPGSSQWCTMGRENYIGYRKWEHPHRYRRNLFIMRTANHWKYSRRTLQSLCLEVVKIWLGTNLRNYVWPCFALEVGLGTSITACIILWMTEDMKHAAFPNLIGR